MATGRSSNNHRFSEKSKQDQLIQEIISLDHEEVNQYLMRNNIDGCGQALKAHSVDGKAFLTLTNKDLLTWGLSIIKRSKIIALLNELGDEAYRKDAVIKTQISSRLNNAVSSLHINIIPSSSPQASYKLSQKATNPNISITINQNHQIKSSGGIPQIQKPCTWKEAANLPNPVLKAKIPYIQEPKSEILARFAGPPLPPKPSFLKSLTGNQHEKIDDPTSENYEIPINVLATPEQSLSNLRKEKEFSKSLAISRFENSRKVESEKFEENYEIPSTCAENVLNKHGVRTFPQCKNDCLPYEDDFTSDEEEEEDEIVDDRKIVPPQAFQDQRPRKKGLFGIFSASRRNSFEEKSPNVDQCATPPIAPSRTCNSSRCSSEASLNQSDSKTPPPTLPPLPSLPTTSSRKVSMTSLNSQSSSASSTRSLTNSSTAIGQKYSVANYPSPLIQDESSPFGSQILSPFGFERSRCPSLSRGTSPCRSNLSSSTDSDVNTGPWFFNVDRKQAEALLKNMGNGGFLIRPSKHGGECAEVTLSLQYNQRIFHVLICRRPDGKLALGTEKRGENMFSSLSELVRHHSVEPMLLHSGKNLAGTTYLTEWP